MKNPSLLFLLALAALPARAADRCDTAWLAKAQPIAARGGTPADPNKYLTTQTVDGAVFPVVDVANAPKVCDKDAWNYIVVGATTPFLWKDDGVRDAWALGLNEQLKILLTVNDLYKLVDAQGADALAKADAVTAAAAKLDAKDASPADLKSSLSQLLADPPAKPVKAGEKPAPSQPPVLGRGVLSFRKAVIGLASELAVHSATRGFAAARGVDAKMAKDFAPGAGAAYAAAAKAAGRDGKADYPDSVAANDAGYASALKYLTDPAITAENDPAAHDGVVLSRLDFALRNKLALRAAAVDQAVAAAKKRLNGQSVKATLAAVEHAAQAAGKAVPDGVPAKGSLGADVLEKLKATKEYSELNSLYDNKSKADPKWADSADGKAAFAQMETMRKDAAGTTVVKTAKGSAVQYSVAGQKVTDAGIQVADLRTDKEYHDFIAGAIASVISSDGKTQAVLAALRGKGGPGDVITPPLTPGQQAAAGDLPKHDPPAAKTSSPWEALEKAAPGTGLFGWFSSRETAERYAAHEQEAISSSASDAMRTRTRVEKQVNARAALADQQAQADERRRVAAAAAKAKADEEDIRRTPQDPDLSPAEAARVQKEAIAAREKAAADEQAKIRQEGAEAKAARDAQAKKDLETAQKAAAQAQAVADAKSKELDETVGKAYDDGVAKSEAQLHGAYKTPGDDRRNKAEELSGYSGKFYRVERVDKYFADKWEGDKLPAATAACKTQLGFKLPVGSGAGFKDPSPDNVDVICGVRDGLVSVLKSYRGSVGVPAAPVAAPAK